MGAANYRALFGRAKAAGADCVYFGGLYGYNGDQLLNDKVSVLGDNDAVKLLAPDGFSEYPDFLARPGAAGAYLTVAGLPMESLTAAGGATALFLAAYQTRYKRDPSMACKPCR